MHGLFSVNTDVQVFYIWIIILHISTIILCQVIDWPATIILFVTVYYMNYLMTFPRWPRILCLESSQSRARRTKSRGISRPPWRRSPQTAESTCSSSLVTRPCSCDIYIWRYTRLRIVITYIATLLLSIIIHKSSLISVEIAKWMFQSYLPVFPLPPSRYPASNILIWTTLTSIYCRSFSNGISYLQHNQIWCKQFHQQKMLKII